MSKQTTRSSSTLAAPKGWRVLVLEALLPHRGKTLTLSELYTAVEKHPEYEKRASSNREPRARIRATCQRLRDQDMLDWKGKGIWHVPETLKV